MELDEALSQPALAVRSSGVTLVDGEDGPVALPAIEVDVAGRPDVADLARVHAVEGVGDVRTLGTRSTDDAGRGWIRLDVVLTRPVLCHFHVELDVEAHRALLDHVAETEALVIATTAPDDHEALWLAVDIERDLIQRLRS